MSTETLERSAYELHFQSLFNAGRGFAFPCDARGRVDMDALGSTCLANYLYARALVGHEYLTPMVRISDRQPVRPSLGRLSPGLASE